MVRCVLKNMLFVVLQAHDILWCAACSEACRSVMFHAHAVLWWAARSAEAGRELVLP